MKFASIQYKASSLQDHPFFFVKLLYSNISQLNLVLLLLDWLLHRLLGHFLALGGLEVSSVYLSRLWKVRLNGILCRRLILLTKYTWALLVLVSGVGVWTEVETEVHEKHQKTQHTTHGQTHCHRISILVYWVDKLFQACLLWWPIAYRVREIEQTRLAHARAIEVIFQYLI